jgi:DNA-binding winged helix-turn-helix (wHTH) protein
MPAVNQKAIHIDGRRVVGRPQDRALLTCLHVNIGIVVPHERFFRALGWTETSITSKKMKTLQQHVFRAKRLLERHNVPCAIAVVEWVRVHTMLAAQTKGPPRN